MEYAISIYKGSKRVYAKDCDFVSYSKQGLICPICKQEVYLRKGNIREPYFAHFHATSSRQVEECELRVSADGNGTETSSLIENRGQRLDIFQQHFISMIYVGQEKIVDNVKFNNWIDSIKRDNNQAINNIIKDCNQYFQYFLTHQRLMEDKYILPSTKIMNC
ncbi:MAG: competence protein CoiA family protein [Nostoc sp.]|uniref:competence protein CoiA family protein n=1 Tax=Nostoc sp. TaxID=1180 RepID=UPI002FFA71F9